jgi:hypothetical protein
VSCRVALVGLVALAVTCFAACGSGSPSVSDDAASELHAQVTAVRTAVGAHDADGAAQALDTLRASVTKLRRSGDVSADRAREILAAATAVQTRLVSITTTTTTTTTVPPTVPNDKGDDHGKGKGNGKGKG